MRSEGIDYMVFGVGQNTDYVNGPSPKRESSPSASSGHQNIFFCVSPSARFTLDTGNNYMPMGEALSCC